MIAVVVGSTAAAPAAVAAPAQPSGKDSSHSAGKADKDKDGKADKAGKPVKAAKAVKTQDPKDRRRPGKTEPAPAASADSGKAKPKDTAKPDAAKPAASASAKTSASPAPAPRTTAAGTTPVAPRAAASPSVTIADIAAPSTPSLTDATPGQHSIAVSWNASTGDGTITYTATATNATHGTFSCSTTSTSCTISSIPNLASYQVRVKATNDGGDSSPSTAWLRTTLPYDPDEPGAPTLTPGNAEINVQWQKPDDPDNQLSGYRVTANPGNKTCSTNGANSLSCKLTALTNDTEYTVTVQAKFGEGGTTDAGPEAKATPVAPEPPGKPTITEVTSDSPHTLTVTFDPPTSGGAYENIAIFAEAGEGESFGMCDVVTGNSCTIEDLAYMNHEIYVVAFMGEEYGESDPGYGWPDPLLPDAPEQPTLTPQQNAMKVEWEDGEEPGDFDHDHYEAVATPGNHSCVTDDADTKTCTITGLQPSTQYSVKVRLAYVAEPDGYSDYSETSSATTPAPGVGPGAPTITNTVRGSGQVAVTWSPGSAGTGTVTGYTVTAQPGGATCTTGSVGLPASRVENGVPTTCTIEALSNYTPYTITVVAHGTVGNSSPSAPAVVTLGPPPAAPTQLQVVANASSIVVSWQAPSNTAGVTGFLAVAEPGPATCKAEANETSCVLGAVVGKTYTVTVYSTSYTGVGNSAGLGPSGPATPTLPQIPAAPPVTQFVLTTDQGNITTAEPGENIVVIGKDFAPFSTVTITLYSSALVLGTATTDFQGNFSKPVKVPPDLDTGRHAMVAFGAGKDGLPRSMRMNITVAEESDAEGLAITGTPVQAIVTIGLLLVAAGTGLASAGRRRRV